MMQSLMHARYLMCGKSKGQMIFLASSTLVGHRFPAGRTLLCRNFKCSSRLLSIHLFLAFIFRSLSVKLKRVTLGSQPSYNGLFESTSSCSSLAFSLEAALSLVVFLQSRPRTCGSRTTELSSAAPSYLQYAHPPPFATGFKLSTHLPSPASLSKAS